VGLSEQWLWLTEGIGEPGRGTQFDFTTFGLVKRQPELAGTKGGEFWCNNFQHWV